MRGVVFQSDGASAVGRLLIRPFEALDRRLAGLRLSPRHPPSPMHAGLHVVLEDGSEVVAEQLVGTLYMDLASGLNWTPIHAFRARDRGGWDLTLPATNFRGVDEGVVREVVGRLNRIEGHPFVGEDCTAFIERAFGGRRLFADSPLLQSLGIGVRIGDPALPLLRPDAKLDDRARTLLQTDAILGLPDARADPGSLNARLWLRRVAVASAIGAGLGLYLPRAHRSRLLGRQAHSVGFHR